jgi:DNA-binding NarL/FixJ family response regulator
LARLVDVAHPDDRQKILETAESQLTGESIEAHLVCRIPFGSDDLRWVEVFSQALDYRGERALLVALLDITAQEEARLALKKANEELERERQQLQAKNIALREVITTVDEERRLVREQVQANVDRLLQPFISDLMNQVQPGVRDNLQNLLHLIANLTKPLSDKPGGKLVQLTPREIEVCRMIKNGLQSKQIAALMGVSSRTIDKFRQSIRRKLGLRQRGQRLQAYLSSV